MFSPESLRSPDIEATGRSCHLTTFLLSRGVAATLLIPIHSAPRISCRIYLKETELARRPLPASPLVPAIGTLNFVLSVPHFSLLAQLVAWAILRSELLLRAQPMVRSCRKSASGSRRLLLLVSTLHLLTLTQVMHFKQYIE